MTITTQGMFDQFTELRRLVDAHFLVQEAYMEGEFPSFVVGPSPDSKMRFLRLRTAANTLDLIPFLRWRNGRAVVSFVRRPALAAWKWQVNFLLFLATLATTFLGGYYLSESLVQGGQLHSAIGGALAFSLPLMLILVTHEAGHKVFSIIRGVDSSWPYFIPFPPIGPPWGTLGAVIITRTPSPNRDAIMDVAAAGPIAGFLVTLPVVILGVAHSYVIDAQGFRGIGFPDPILLRLLQEWILHPPAGSIVLGHPLLHAGWVGLLVTGLNLLPAGMLDGGHTTRALLGPRVHTIISWIAAPAAILLGYWVMGLLIILLVRRGHPGPLDDVSPPSPLRRAIGLLLLLIFIVSFVPFRVTLYR